MGELGQEASPAQFVTHLVEVFREVRRVLHPSGLCFVVMDDSYGRGRTGRAHGDGRTLTGGVPRTSGSRNRRAAMVSPKSLCLVPERLAIALADDGWVIRNRINWVKLNQLPESCKDRFTVDYETVWMFAKSETPYFDEEPVRELATGNGAKGSKFNSGKTALHQANRSSDRVRAETPGTRRPRATWVINVQPYSGAHLAVFPEKLVERMLLCSTSEHGACATCGAPFKRIVEKGAPLIEHQRACGADSVGGYQGVAQKDYAAAVAQDPSATKARILKGMRERRTVGWQPTCTCKQDSPPVPCLCLDPFSGSGTTGVVAKRLGRRAILIDMSAEYIQLARKRVGDS